MIYTEKIKLPAPDINEILRYAGVREADGGLLSAVDECLAQVLDYGKVCYAQVPVAIEENKVIFNFGEVESKALAHSLMGCNEAVIFACTLGTEFDTVLRRYSLTDVSKAVVMQAVGTERIETLCDAFMEKFSTKTRRFSPGYGDLSLEFQKEIISFLDCYKKIGLSLGGSLIMSPSKSVTAIFGLGKEDCSKRDCCLCEMWECPYRKE